MQRSVYLQGELGERFGTKFTVHTSDYGEIFKCINANRPSFLPYIRDCHNKDINFILEVAGEPIAQDSMLLPLQEGDITLAVAPAGSKSGVAKILMAVVIIAFLVYNPLSLAGGGNLLSAAFGSSAYLGAAGTMAVGFASSMAVSLAMAGLQQIMAPDPAVDSDSPTNYLFTGGASSAIEGDPIPILYGELRIPGRPISIDILNGTYITNNTIPDSFNNLNQTATTETYIP